jgi:hypothetical protein
MPNSFKNLRYCQLRHYRFGHTLRPCFLVVKEAVIIKPSLLNS